MNPKSSTEAKVPSLTQKDTVSADHRGSKLIVTSQKRLSRHDSDDHEGQDGPKVRKLLHGFDIPLRHSAKWDNRERCYVHYPSRPPGIDIGLRSRQGMGSPGWCDY